MALLVYLENSFFLEFTTKNACLQASLLYIAI